MSIFDDIAREGMEPRPDGEALFAYTNRSGRAEAQRVRQNVDAWLEAYPADKRDALVARLRSANDEQHRSAFFELFLFQFLRKRGHSIIAVEPKLEHTDKSPDFLVETSQQERFYVEAVMATGLSAQEVSAQARLNTAIAAIDGTPSPKHFLDMKIVGTPTQPISVKKMKRALQSWIASLPSDETAKDAKPFLWDEHGASIQLNAWTRNKPGDEGPSIGVRRTPVINVEPSREIFPSLKKKASRYGKLDHPYLVALNAVGAHHRDEAVVDALFGTPYFRVRKDAAGNDVMEELRQPDGIWYGPPDGRAQNTRLSGVVALKGIDAWNFASKNGLLIPNPWAAKPLPHIDLGTSEMVQVGNGFERNDGKAMHELLEFPASWPEA